MLTNFLTAVFLLLHEKLADLAAFQMIVKENGLVAAAAGQHSLYCEPYACSGLQPSCARWPKATTRREGRI
jgi:hypothetical protein